MIAHSSKSRSPIDPGRGVDVILAHAPSLSRKALSGVKPTQPAAPLFPHKEGAWRHRYGHGPYRAQIPGRGWMRARADDALGTTVHPEHIFSRIKAPSICSYPLRRNRPRNPDRPCRSTWGAPRLPLRRSSPRWNEPRGGRCIWECRWYHGSWALRSAPG